MKKLVLIGGGYGNMRVLHRLLPNQLPDDVSITLIDRNPYHCLKTEYYALAAGTISDHHIRVSFPEHPRLDVQYGDISSIDIAQKQVLFQDREPISYDDAVIGLGCEDKYHNVPGAPEFTYSIQTIDQSRETYQKLNNLSANATVAIVGAGLSGVELASELRESRDDLNIILFDRGNLILSSFPERLSKYVQKWFEEHGVRIINRANITKVEEGVVYNHEDRISADAIVWTAGIQPNKVVRDLDVEKDAQGRIVLTPHHNLPDDEHLYVVGDCASLPHAPSAQLAEAQAEQIVQILQKRWNGEALPESMPQFKLKGVLGSLGKKAGFGLVADRPLIGRVPRMLKSGLLWMYKHHNG
ncbi:NAD(P)/FAD-dependent oxidoreductase [Bacillus vallismortis]|uniref:NAD(P)/FAD-dependent oxidoreductase n=1 Tax=Bacillus vallismortis TaxID=72361 RepID=A0AAP3CFL0_BACVA|nr:NAD(P)/FAD-dependent oxidoreductase [Bacillus vallismortis]MCY7919212.1 NAD(P)/FAD-dependent oxidoreductase [Bacillus vallismortis]MCY8309451.1 NAD(P)/FAD-dependent oxidoreductase [Bacillus vallismortis]MCY8315718.1 NAD(P)/FAD-dependent oxidoreductase [Bacillus vallismortis]MCY8423868.1 NAD(P)/FAD-dependent oxidoreductase [Bacillus vallismortis]MCY8532819.1 NAD(P)/FAD-dependent oxidoreductase [Bacillus vallismortis]